MAFFHSEAPANGDGVENLYDFYNGIHPVSIHIDMLNSRELVSDFFTILAFGRVVVPFPTFCIIRTYVKSRFWLIIC